VVSSLGDPGGERTVVIANRSPARPGDFVALRDLEACLEKSGLEVSGKQRRSTRDGGERNG
jgi:hypothetical protein